MRPTTARRTHTSWVDQQAGTSGPIPPSGVGKGSKAPEDGAPVAQEMEEAGGTEVKEGFEASLEEGRGGERPDRMHFFLCFVLFCFWWTWGEGVVGAPLL